MDDDELIRSVLTRFLGRNGWRVIAAINAEAALSAFKAAPCLAAILDVESQFGVDGFSAAARLLELEPALKIVMMSGNPVYAQKARAVGYPFLSKPFMWQELLSALGREA